jgi:hypothetical protein
VAAIIFASKAGDGRISGAPCNRGRKLALIGDSIGQSAVESSAPELKKASGKSITSPASKVIGISSYGFLTYLFLSCIFLTDTADLAMIGRLAKTVVLDQPTSHWHITLAFIVFTPAIAAAFVRSYFSSSAERFQTLSWSALGRCSVITLFVLAIKFGDFSRWQSLCCIAILSFLSAYAFVPRLGWMIDMRKLSFAGSFHLVLFGLALFSSIALANQGISTVALCQLALVSTALASIGFRFMARRHLNTVSSQSALRHLLSLIATKSFTILTGLAIWSCLALASIEQYQSDENYLLNFATVSCLGIVLGAGLALLRLKRSVTAILAYILRALATLVLIVFGFLGNYLTPQAFFFVFTALWSASYTCELSWPRGTTFADNPRTSANLDQCMAWGQAIVLTTIFFICLATCAGIDTVSSALQLRKFALASGIVSLVSLVFISRSLARRLRML